MPRISFTLSIRSLAALLGISPTRVHQLLKENNTEQLTEHLTEHFKGIKDLKISSLDSEKLNTTLNTSLNTSPSGHSSFDNSISCKNNKEKENNIIIPLKEKKEVPSPPPTPSKVKADTTDASQFDWVAPEYLKPFQDWLTFKWVEFKKKYKDERYLKQQYNKLVSLSGGNAAEAQQIVDQSITNLWQGLFALKNKGTSSTGVIIKDNDNKDKYKHEQLQGW